MQSLFAFQSVRGLNPDESKSQSLHKQPTAQHLRPVSRARYWTSIRSRDSFLPFKKLAVVVFVPTTSEDLSVVESLSSDLFTPNLPIQAFQAFQMDSFNAKTSSASGTQPTVSGFDSHTSLTASQKYLPAQKHSVTKVLLEPNNIPIVPRPCPYHGPIISLSTCDKACDQTGVMERFLQEGPAEQSALFNRPDNDMLSISKRCTCLSTVEKRDARP